MSHVARKQHYDTRQASAQAAQLVSQRTTCEGCAFLRGVRPMCQAEESASYRQPRHTGSDRCEAYAVKGGAKPAAKPEPQPVSRAAVAGEVAKRKHNRWAGSAA